MANPITVKLPAATKLYATAFANTSNMYKVTVSKPAGGGVATSFQGTNKDGVLGHSHFTTVAAPGAGQDDSYSLEIQYSTDGGNTWSLSTISQIGSLGFNTYHLRVVTAGDTPDGNLDDCVVEFNWFTAT